MDEELGNVIREIVEKLRRDYNPLKVILFGSAADGKATSESDLDLFILKDTDKPRAERFIEVKRIIYDPKRKLAISPLVYTPQELKERLELGDDFLIEIITKGIVLYEREAG